MHSFKRESTSSSDTNGCQEFLAELNQGYEKAVLHAQLESKFQMGGLLLQDKTSSKHAEGIAYLIEAAEGGHLIAIYNYAWYLEHGGLIEKNLTLAIEWYAKLAEIKHIPLTLYPNLNLKELIDTAKFKTALYFLHEKEEKKRMKAFLWFCDLDKQGNLHASYFVANIYLEQSVSKNKEDATKLVRKGLDKLSELAKRKYGKAELALGKMFLGEFGIIKNVDLAEYYFTCAAVHGESEAYYQLSKIYDEREAYAVSFEFLERAAKLGFTPALFDLGVRLYEGIHLPDIETVDKKQGLELIKTAAQKGNAAAQKKYATIQAAEFESTNSPAKKIVHFVQSISALHALSMDANPLVKVFNGATLNNDQLSDTQVENYAQFVVASLPNSYERERFFNMTKAANTIVKQSLSTETIPQITSTTKQAKNRKKGSQTYLFNTSKPRKPKTNFSVNTSNTEINEVSCSEQIITHDDNKEDLLKTESVTEPKLPVKDKPKKKKKAKRNMGNRNPSKITSDNDEQESDSAIFSVGTSVISIELPDYIKQVLAKLEQGGYQAYVHGGFSRDTLLKLKPRDVDIITNRPSHEIPHIVEAKPHPHVTDLFVIINDNFPFKIDICYRDALNTSIIAEAKEGDFKFNKIFVNQHNCIVYPSQEELAKIVADGGKPKTISFYHNSFTEYPSLLLRYMDYIARGFPVSYTPRDLKKYLPNLLDKNKIEAEKVDFYFCKLFMSGNAVKSYEVIHRFGAFPYILPEFKINNEQASIWLKLKLGEVDAKFNEKKYLAKHRIYALFIVASIDAASVKAIPSQDQFIEYAKALLNKCSVSKNSESITLVNNKIFDYACLLRALLFDIFTQDTFSVTMNQYENSNKHMQAAISPQQSVYTSNTLFKSHVEANLPKSLIIQQDSAKLGASFK
jgi:TPR repeat protein/tRNA nucleotidyltransferase/poly(A) polymerase